MRTSIRFPTSRDLPQDSKGRPQGEWEWSETAIPAACRSMTARERNAAYAAGYTAERSYIIIKDAYTDDLYFRDDSDGQTYQIGNTSLSTDGHWITLEAARVSVTTYPVGGV